MSGSSGGKLNPKKKAKLTLFELVLFSMFGALMFGSKVLMEFLPNMHLLGFFIVTFTAVFRVKALIPIYIFVLLNGILAGFSPWWIPYLYVWTVLWGMAMLIPKNIPDKVAMFVYPLVCALHGLLFGVIYAPAQALLFHLNFEQTLAWVAAGFPFDLIHCVSNFLLGLLVLPMKKVLCKLCSSVSNKICNCK